MLFLHPSMQKKSNLLRSRRAVVARLTSDGRWRLFPCLPLGDKMGSYKGIHLPLREGRTFTGLDYTMEINFR